MGLRNQDPFTFGMECEISRYRCGIPFDSMPWFRFQNNEGNVIKEYIIGPFDGVTFLKKACFLAHLFGWEHMRGHTDPRAESFHLHMGHPRTNHYNKSHVASHNRLHPLLLGASHMARNEKTFRTHMTCYNPIADASYRQHVIAGRGGWIGRNDIGTMELRLNENPAPIIPVALFPLIHSRHHGLNLPNNLSTKKKPPLITKMIRESIGDEKFREVLNTAKRHWRRKFMDIAIDAFYDGADQRQVWELVDQYWQRLGDREYMRLLELRGGS